MLSCGGGERVGYNGEKELEHLETSRTLAKLPNGLRKRQLPRTRSLCLSAGTRPVAVDVFNMPVSHMLFGFRSYLL